MTCLLIFLKVLRLHGSFASFFQLSQISKNFSNILNEKNPHLSGPVWFKPVLLKGQLYLKTI